MIIYVIKCRCADYFNLIQLLPHDIRHILNNFQQESDKKTHLLSYLLKTYFTLGKGWYVNEFGKPMSNIYNNWFNISHVDNYVIGCMSYTGSVGIDISMLKPIQNIFDFRSCFTDKEWKIIYADSTLILIYEWWTKKESFFKYLGTGLTIDPSTVEILPDTTILFNNIKLHDVHILTKWINKSHVCSVCLPYDESIEFSSIDENVLFDLI